MVSLDTIFPACTHHDSSTNDVSLQELSWVFYTAVNMRFCRKVDNDIGMFFLKQPVDSFSITDICFNKAEVRIVHYRGKCRQIASIGQVVETNNSVLRMLF